jgi:hypothetical protein
VEAQLKRWCCTSYAAAYWLCSVSSDCFVAMPGGMWQCPVDACDWHNNLCLIRAPGVVAVASGACFMMVPVVWSPHFVFARHALSLGFL